MNTNFIKSFFLLFVTIQLLGLNATAQQLNIKNYSINEGLPQSQIISLFQDHTGIIWCGTNGGGVARFDGINFQTLNLEKDNHVRTIFEDSHQTIWIGTDKGLNTYKNDILSAIYGTSAKFSIYEICELQNGELWFGTDDGITIYDGKKFKPFIGNDSIGKNKVVSITQDKLGNVWVATSENGVFCYRGTTMVHYTEADGLIGSSANDIIINNNEVWIATPNGVNTLNLSNGYLGKQKLETLKINGKLFNEPSLRFFKDNNGTIWVGTANGVSKITFDKVISITKSNGLCGPQINAIIQDKEGNMWFGSSISGISKYHNNLFININTRHGLLNDVVMSIYKGSNENMWIGTSGGGLSLVNYKLLKDKDSISIKNFTQSDGLPDNHIRTICEDKNGNIWIGTDAHGVSVFDGKKFINFGLQSFLHGTSISDILSDKRGNIWIAHEKGVDKFDGNSFTFYGTEKGFSDQGVKAIYEDKLGQLWFCSHDKIVKYDDGDFISIIRDEGLQGLRNIASDRYGYMWFSTEAGALVFNGSTFKSISEKDGLVSNLVSYTIPDNEGNIWMGTNNGIDKFDVGRFVNNMEYVFKHYGKEEGFFGLECNPNAFSIDIDGRLWIGTDGGITIYDPKQDKVNTAESQIQISNIRLFLEDTDFSKYSDSSLNRLPLNLKLPYNKNHITFDFIGISHSNPAKVRYQFMLEGFDPDWLPITAATSATYSNLPAGDYTFLLKASNSDGRWSSAPVRFSFKITPPFWKEPWFFISVVIILLLSIYITVKVRERSYRQSKKILAYQVSVRTSELREEKEKLQVAYTEIDEKNKDITDSIHYAKRIQNAILPPDNTVNQLLNESFVLYMPKAIVSGDFYWIEKWGSQTMIAAVDCTGHGVPGAFMSIVGHNILTQSVNVLGLTTPAFILNETNSQLSKKLNQDPEKATVRDGMDIALIAVNYSKLKMEFAGANNPIWIIRNEQVIKINGDKFPIGVFVGEELQKFANHELDLQKGDCIYLFTDGYADQFGGPKGKKFKYRQFEELLLANHLKPFEEQKQILENTIKDWMGDLEQIDDILVIGIQI